MDKPSHDLYLSRYHGSHGTMGKEYRFSFTLHRNNNGSCEQ